MAGADDPRGGDRRRVRQLEREDGLEHRDEELDTGELQVRGVQAVLADRRRLLTGALVLILVVVAIYVLVPAILGLEEVLARIADAAWYWVAVGIGFMGLAFASYVSLFRGVVGRDDEEAGRRLDLRASYQITMAGLAATRLFSAGGAGGIVLTYWALRKAGMPRRRSACRMVAFLVLMYSIYLAALVVFGTLLRADVVPGEAPLGGTVVPAAVAGGVIAVFLLIALIPGDVERRIARLTGGYRRMRHLARLAKGPATVATGVRTAIDYVRQPRRGTLAIGGAAGFWGANIGVLWASFEAFGGDVPLAVLVQGFFLGMAANLIPSPAGGAGSVDAGMIAAFVLFGVPTAVVFPAVLTYRVIAFWLPIPPGAVAYFQLRATVAAWEREREEGAPAGIYTSKSKVRTAEAS